MVHLVTPYRISVYRNRDFVLCLSSGCYFILSSYGDATVEGIFQIKLLVFFRLGIFQIGAVKVFQLAIFLWTL